MLKIYIALVYRQMVLFEELVLLKEFEKTENVLMAKLQDKCNEKLAMDKMVSHSLAAFSGGEDKLQNVIYFLPKSITYG